MNSQQDSIYASGLLAGRFACPDLFCYELGCSLGAAALAMRRQVQAEQHHSIALK